MTQTQPPEQRHLPSLDGWRGVSILLVLLSHLWAMRGHEEIEPYLLGLASYGNLGVRMFFTISGFLITHLLLQEQQQAGHINLKAFYIRRTLRIWPAYFSYLLALAALTVSGLYTDSASSWLGALTFTRNLIGQGRSLTSHLWSLGVEEQFYLLWPLALVLLIRPKKAFYATLIALCAAAVFARTFRTSFTDPGAFYQRALGINSPIMYADALAVGCIAARMLADQQIRLWLGQFQTMFLLAAMIAVSLTQPASPQSLTLLVFAQALVFAALMVSTVIERSGPTFWLLNSKPLVTIGVLSYSLYIWHALFLGHYAGDRLSALPIYHWSVAIPLIFVVATASYFIVERPMSGLRRRFGGHAATSRDAGALSLSWRRSRFSR